MLALPGENGSAHINIFRKGLAGGAPCFKAAGELWKASPTRAFMSGGKNDWTERNLTDAAVVSKVCYAQTVWSPTPGA